MRITITQSRSRIMDLIRRAQGGEDVVLIYKGVAVARLVPVVETAGSLDAADETAAGAAPCNPRGPCLTAE